jgi:hypothetical protein
MRDAMVETIDSITLADLISQNQARRDQALAARAVVPVP